MTIDSPTAARIPQLQGLWQEAFGDPQPLLDSFFCHAFSPERSRCITKNDQVVAALYWFDCRWQHHRLAYLYAVATAKDCRRQGLCRALMEDTHRHLAASGYDGCILMPQEDHLFSLYSKMGYRVCSHIRQFSCTAEAGAISLEPATPAQYAVARRSLLPKNAVIQEGATLDFLSTYARLYTGPEIALAAYPEEGELMVCELLGTPESAPQILAALGFPRGTFRVPGEDAPFAMYLPLGDDDAMPTYFGLALD